MEYKFFYESNQEYNQMKNVIKQEILDENRSKLEQLRIQDALNSFTL